MMLYDEDNGQLFTGDLIYPTTLLALLPGSSRSAYLDSATDLLRRAGPDTELLTGHVAFTQTQWRPRFSVSDLSDLQGTLEDAREGRREAEGIFPRTYRVDERIELERGSLGTIDEGIHNCVSDRWGKLSRPVFSREPRSRGVLRRSYPASSISPPLCGRRIAHFSTLQLIAGHKYWSGE
jgi:hypothetical protein